ncbi:hypothetical protein [Halomontanus rarus]|uniref:hypothetical protein n=1 Tax=Halomontanus rarus TaxID=3034020 RepID=UPI001A994F42
MGHDSRTRHDDETDDAGPLESETGRRTVSNVRDGLRRAVESGAVAGIGGGLCLLDGRRAFRRGDEERGLVSLLLGGLLVAVAITQRRPVDDGMEEISLERSPVIDSSAGVDDATGDSTGTPERGAGVGTEVEPEETETERDAEIEIDSASESADVENPATGVREGSRSGAGPTVESDADEQESEESEDGTERESTGLEDSSVERIGEAAFDRQSGQIPIPQRVFNNNVLALNSEVFWGIREVDDAVVVSGLFDPIQDEDGVRYVASTQVDDDRMLTVPDAVLNHWDGVAGGGTAVVSGDGLVFGIDEGLRSDDQLLVVPAAWADDLLGEGE